MGTELRIRDIPLVAKRKTEVQAGLRRHIELVVRNVVTERVAAVVGEPELTGHGMPGEPNAIPDALREDLGSGAIRLHPNDRRRHRCWCTDVAR